MLEYGDTVYQSSFEQHLVEKDETLTYEETGFTIFFQLVDSIDNYQTWDIADYEGYLEFNLIKYSVQVNEDNRLTVSSDTIETHRCNDTDRQYFKEITDFEADFFKRLGEESFYKYQCLDDPS